MSFTPESSLESMSRLGRATNLLERSPLDNGNTLSGRVLSFIKKNQRTGGLLTILGHPSAGKTTELSIVTFEPSDVATNLLFNSRLLILSCYFLNY